MSHRIDAKAAAKRARARSGSTGEVALSPRIKASAEEMAVLAEWPSDKDAYEFNVKIGEGNFANVHVATVKSNPERICAIKKMNFEVLDFNIESIRKEITTMTRCLHPNVLSLHRSFTDKEFLYIVLPYMECGSFRDVIVQREEYMQNHPGAVLLEEDWIAITICETCKGLEYIHKCGWMHRDLKAANILLNRLGQVKIADFGVAGMKDTPDPILRKQEQQRRTFVGTPCWMAPEVMRQQEGYSDRADVWSLGICVLELAKSYPPYAKERAMKVLLRTIRDPPPNFDTYKEFEPEDAPKRKFSANIKNFVRALLVKDAKSRPTASKCLSMPFLKPFANKPELNQQRLRDELCVNLINVDVRQADTMPHTVMVRDADGLLHPVEVDEKGIPILPPVQANEQDRGGNHQTPNGGDASGPANSAAASRTPANDGDISVTDLSKELASLSDVANKNTDTSGTPAPTDSGLNSGQTSTDQSIPSTLDASTPSSTEKRFTAQLSNRRVASNAHNGSQSLKPLKESPEFVDVDAPLCRPRRFVSFSDPRDEILDVYHTVQHLVDENARIQAQREAAAAAAAKAALAASNSSDADVAAGVDQSPPEPRDSSEPTEAEEAALAQQLEKRKLAAARKKKEAEEAEHAALGDDVEFGNAFAGI